MASSSYNSYLLNLVRNQILSDAGRDDFEGDSNLLRRDDFEGDEDDLAGVPRPWKSTTGRINKVCERNLSVCMRQRNLMNNN